MAASTTHHGTEWQRPAGRSHSSKGLAAAWDSPEHSPMLLSWCVAVWSASSYFTTLCNFSERKHRSQTSGSPTRGGRDALGRVS